MKYCSITSMILSTAWDALPKKKASGVDDCDLGVVEEVQDEFIITEKGIINKNRYYLPKILIAGFDGHILYFRIMKAELHSFPTRRSSDLKSVV